MNNTANYAENVFFEHRTRETYPVSQECGTDTVEFYGSNADISLLDYSVFTKESYSALRQRIDVFAEYAVWMIQDIKESVYKKDGQLLANYGTELSNACVAVGAPMLLRLAKTITKRGLFNDFEDIDTLIVQVEQCYGQTVEKLSDATLTRNPLSRECATAHKP